MLTSETSAQRKRWQGPATTYYGLPLLKQAPWKWQIVLYFFLGGIAGGSYLVATLADLLDRANKAALIRAGRYLSFGCLLVSPILLIWDLGQPWRFHHMLRVLKFRSVMSLGTWGLTAFGLFNGLSVTHQLALDGLFDWFSPLMRLAKALPIRTIEVIGGLLGLFVASYTGVLLSSTAVPVWARARYLLGPLFLTSGLSTALASLSLLLSFGQHEHATSASLESAEVVTMTTEVALIAALVPTLGPLGKPFIKDRQESLVTAVTVGGGLILPLLLHLFWKLTGKPMSRNLTRGTALAVLIGGLMLRQKWIRAGRISSDDPQAVHYYNARTKSTK